MSIPRPSRLSLSVAVLMLVAALGYFAGVRADQSGPTTDSAFAAQTAAAAAVRCDTKELKHAAADYATARPSDSSDQQAQADMLLSQAISAYAACAPAGTLGAVSDREAVTLPVSIYAASSASWLDGSSCVPTAIGLPSVQTALTGLTEFQPAVVVPLADGRTAVAWLPAGGPTGFTSLSNSLTGQPTDCQRAATDAPVVLTAPIPVPLTDLPASPLSSSGATNNVAISRSNTTTTTSQFTQITQHTGRSGGSVIPQPQPASASPTPSPTPQ